MSPLACVPPGTDTRHSASSWLQLVSDRASEFLDVDRAAKRRGWSEGELREASCPLLPPLFATPSIAPSTSLAPSQARAPRDPQHQLRRFALCTWHPLLPESAPGVLAKGSFLARILASMGALCGRAILGTASGEAAGTLCIARRDGADCLGPGAPWPFCRPDSIYRARKHKGSGGQEVHQESSG